MRRRTKLLLVLSASLVGACLLLEGTLRFVLFSPLAREIGIGWSARKATLYTAREVGPETWRLDALFEAPRSGEPFRFLDARFGWLKGTIEPTTLAHKDEDCLQGRRPVLLFGDSYAQCTTRLCWQDLLEASPLGERYRLLNYGVGGFGVDQMRILMASVLERFAALDPLVVIGILVDDDLDRCYLDLRNFPKPHFRLVEGGLTLEPQEFADSLSFARAHPPAIASYLGRWLLFQSGLVARERAIAWTGGAEHVAEKEELCQRILIDLVAELDARGLEHFVVLFHARNSFEAPGLYGWQEPFLYRVLPELGTPFVSSRTFLREHLAQPGTSLDALYIHSGPGMNHLTPLGNEIVFGAFVAGLEGRFEAPAGAKER